MSEQFNRLLILGLKRAIVATFNQERWLELGCLLNTDIIVNHPRLLRSLSWGDADYPENVIYMLEKLFREQKNIKAINDYVKPDIWLKENDPELFSRIYLEAHLPLDKIWSSAEILDIVELNKHADRIRRSIDNDPELAIGSTKELLETVFKAVIAQYGRESTDDNLPTLWKQVQAELKLHPKGVQKDMPGSESFIKLRGSLNQIVYSIAEIRNIYGTGHGKLKPKEPSGKEARLVVNSGIALATYILEKLQEEKEGLPF